MTELQILERLRSRFGVTGRGVVLGIGDDCAIFRPVGSPQDLVFTTDQMIEGAHFHPGARPSWIGEKALARALSDIAAMAADPRFCLVSLAVPSRFDIDAFYRGLGRIAGRFRIPVAGGDLARSTSVSCDVVVCGSVPRGRALRRDGARPGDAIYVSGPLGRSALCKYRNVPEPRIAWGRKLRGRATSGMDLSDGLSLDLHRLCKASSAGATLFKIPKVPGATLPQALHGGEDYELLYTGRNLPGIEIGVITDVPSGLVTFRGLPIIPEGWDHFA